MYFASFSRRKLYFSDIYFSLRETTKYRFYFRVVVRLGSTSPFSQELNELQEEVKPLWKMPSCPRDFKRTSVEILFREAEFRLDWCSFRLVSCVRLNCVATCDSFAAINVIYPRGVSFICLRCENCLLTLLPAVYNGHSRYLSFTKVCNCVLTITSTLSRQYKSSI